MCYKINVSDKINKLNPAIYYVSSIETVNSI